MSFLSQLCMRYNRSRFSRGSARALACCGRRLGDRRRLAGAEGEVECDGRAEGVFGEAPKTTREGAGAPLGTGLCAAILAAFLGIATGRAGPVQLSARSIALPAGAGSLRFVDVDQDGRSDLLVIEPRENRLLNYHQRSDGFVHSPDQTIPLPPDTAWVAAGDVDTQRGLELILSTEAGVFFRRQEEGIFEPEQHPLIQVQQSFSNCDYPVLTSLATNQVGMTKLIPVFSAGQAVLYQRTDAGQWRPGPSPVLDQNTSFCQANHRYPWDDWWALGPNTARNLRIDQSFRLEPKEQREDEPSHETIRKILEEMKKTSPTSQAVTNRLDVNGDGREDFVLWQVSNKLHFKTDLYIFLRGSDRQLPAEPTQILHCRGLPIPIDSTLIAAPLQDLNGDGVCELVLLELKTHFISASGLIETALSHGLDWALTIRSFEGGAFNRRSGASVPLKGILPAQVLNGWPFFIDGDYNGDGRPDLVVRRSDTRWNIFVSTTDSTHRDWFEPEPAMGFDTPAQGHLGIRDLNGDGSSDLVWFEPGRSRLFIFMSPSRRAKAKSP